MVATFSLTTLLLASAIIAATAKPIVERNARPRTLSLSRHIRSDIGYRPVVQDRSRAKAFSSNLGDNLNSRILHDRAAQAVDSAAENEATLYTVTIAVGDPPTNYNIQVDTGSSNTWVGADASNPYVQTKTSHPTSNNVSVSYGSGEFSGIEFTDQVTIAPGLVITNQSIGGALMSAGFVNIDGILGLGPSSLTRFTLTPDGDATVPTVTDTLFSSNIIPEHLVGVFFAPISSASGEESNGELTWGGVSSKNVVGSIAYASITKTSPANNYWAIDTTVSYGPTTILANSASLVDTGTTLILMANDGFNAYQKFTGGVLDSSNTGLITITLTQYKQLQNLSVSVGNATFHLTPNGQIWPRALNAAIGGIQGSIYLVITSFQLQGITNPNDVPSQLILGMAFLERFYSVFDTGNQRVGFAQTVFTNATTN